ncbi:hypothetical protein BV25DRAFT_1824638 [Artomyces pyxidatus]|uniref:Uncharacterized protein n=1 Tax=Artomyces pyxidatus TaxID=48021 RepID=A0ACB8T3N1_9AGAM|nr:hypothetical protein BV25DRAFT_1824638 [Artomyces pyxidatus]
MSRSRTEQWAYNISLTPITARPDQKIPNTNAPRYAKVPVDLGALGRPAAQHRHTTSSDASPDDSMSEDVDSSEISSLSDDAEERDAEAALAEDGPDDLDDPWPYTFAAQDKVWIRTEGGNWHRGFVSGKNVKTGMTRQKEGFFYPVIFCKRIRKYFSPLNGEIKPDTARTRTLLRQHGLSVESDD